MKRIMLVQYDYDSADCSEWATSRPAILIDDYTLITKDDDFFDIIVFKEPIEVTTDNYVIMRGFSKAELKLNSQAKSLDILDVATMTVARFTKLLSIGGY